MKSDNKIIKLFILTTISTFLLTTGTMIIEPVNSARLSAVVAYLQTADASQGPSYKTFDSLGDCHKFAKQSDGVYDKKDCKKGSPPSDDTEDTD